METHLYYIYEVQGHKVGATKDWSNRRQYNFDKYGIEPIVIETMEGPNTEDTWQIVGDREWELADERGYPRGEHYLGMMQRTLASLTEESHAKISEARKGQTHSAETRAKMSEARKGKPKSAEHRAKMSESLKGHTISAETRAKLSATLKGKPQEQATCPHCGKTGGINNMKRYHFDNCKQKTT